MSLCHGVYINKLHELLFREEDKMLLSANVIFYDWIQLENDFRTATIVVDDESKQYLSINATSSATGCTYQ